MMTNLHFDQNLSGRFDAMKEFSRKKFTLLDCLKYSFFCTRNNFQKFGVNLYLARTSKQFIENPKKKISQNLAFFYNVWCATRKSSSFKSFTFESDFYTSHYDDLRNLDHSAWIHFFRHGFDENRRTSSQIDLDFISKAYFGNRQIVTIQDYLFDKRYWTVKPSAYFKSLDFTSTLECYNINPFLSNDGAKAKLSLLEKLDAEYFSPEMLKRLI